MLCNYGRYINYRESIYCLFAGAGACDIEEALASACYLYVLSSLLLDILIAYCKKFTVKSSELVADGVSLLSPLAYSSTDTAAWDIAVQHMPFYHKSSLTDFSELGAVALRGWHIQRYCIFQNVAVVP